MIIHPPAIEADSQLQKRLCRRGLRASLAHTVHLEGYLALGLKVLSLRRLAIRRTVSIPARKAQRLASEGGPYTPRGDSLGSWKVDAKSWSTVFFQDHA
jgi:hypothetical protein